MHLSFEYYPPKSKIALAKLLERHRSYLARKPSFVSLTYGAGGMGGQELAAQQARDILPLLLQDFDKVAAHITVAGQSKSKVMQQVGEWYDMGIRHFVALRGDHHPTNPTNPKAQDAQEAQEANPAPGFYNAAELVAEIRLQLGGRVRISVAAYPETHQDSLDEKSDIANLCAKFAAGADDALTQFFYKPELYPRLVENVRREGFTQPIVPGVLPIHDPDKVKNFAERCGASVPRETLAPFAGINRKEDPERYLEVATQETLKLARALLKCGAPGLHFFTLNQQNIVDQVCLELLAAKLA